MMRSKTISFDDNNNGFKYSPVEKRITTKIHLIVKKNDGNNNTNSNDKNMKK